MALIDILNHIEESYQKKILEIKKEQEQKISSIFQSVSYEQELIKEQIKEISKREIEENKKRKLAIVYLELRKEILQVKQKIIEEIFKKAYQIIINLDLDKYLKLIKKLIKNNAETGEEEIVFSLNDKERISKTFIEEINQELKKEGKRGNLILSNKNHQGEGFLLLYKDEKIINCTFKTIFDKIKEDLETKVSKILFE